MSTTRTTMVRRGPAEPSGPAVAPPDPGLASTPEPTATVYESALTLIAVVRRHGATDAQILNATGIDVRRLKGPLARVPLSRLEKLWDFAAQVTGNPGIALQLHQYYPENKLHFVAHLGMRARTLREALISWRQYASLVCEADEVDFAVDGSVARFIYRCRDPRYESRWFAEHFLSLAAWFALSFTAAPLRAHQVNFMHPDPGCPEAYRQAFYGAPVNFLATENSIVFDAQYLELPFCTADSYLQHFLKEQAEELKRRLERDTPVSNRVMFAISALIQRGEEVSFERVSEVLEQPPRKLRQQLEAEGRRFRDLVDEVRRHSAARYLKWGLSITQMTEMLGFSEPSALQHAFRRWFRATPGALRAQMKSGDPTSD
ncbi:MAG: AraC family transcriptional regulator ligand-binding domain-containing protein [Caldimonas manganoxidans]|uniref:AraC family transcriptional regulator ligand-binding domain-containing protein n=1 Tax=Caldimonas taiwanensis TaxID=307483 RepID=UPI0009FD14D0|nr:AraC family transcriptional regulator ligand-binding domain-containing protein [Caldimonas taiwanensis]MCX7659648.1 AraC family transcriptional regulator ligand-binding domain-containing protein [Caldimonas manganoxidans]GIX25625.1 MAG: transcriptional regulator [Caldimonas sp.]